MNPEQFEQLIKSLDGIYAALLLIVMVLGWMFFLKDMSGGKK